MKLTFILPTIALTLAGAGHAQQRALSDPVIAAANPEALFTSRDAKLNRNKQAALHIEKELLQCSQWSRAGEWLTDKYIQHNPVAASGLKGVQDYFINVAKRQPTPTCDQMTAPVVAVVAEGDYVTVLTVRPLPYADDPTKTYTTTWFDTWRFVDGKADEHWDPMALAAPAPRAAPVPAAAPAAYLGTEADRAAIGRLMWNYDRALDNYDADAYVNSFTPDGAFGRTKGRDALRTMVLGFQKTQADRRAKGETLGKMRHFTMNQYLEFIDPTHARYHYYHQTVFGSGVGGNDTAPVVVAAGNGADDLVKVGGQWYIQYRNVGPTLAQE
ncbi:MAG: nuclear transport factor 2 family protein [Croceibacterium sp.]